MKFKNLNQRAHEIEGMEEELAQLNKEVKVAEQDENQPDKRMEEATKKLEAAERKQD